MTPSQSLRIVVIAPDSLYPEAGDAHELHAEPVERLQVRFERLAAAEVGVVLDAVPDVRRGRGA
jgi:hypothetical protein